MYWICWNVLIVAFNEIWCLIENHEVLHACIETNEFCNFEAVEAKQFVVGQIWIETEKSRCPYEWKALNTLRDGGDYVTELNIEYWPEDFRDINCHRELKLKYS